ncbi:MAG: FG-GAP-like repeat-containing protein [Acidobacteriota bacterium]
MFTARGLLIAALCFAATFSTCLAQSAASASFSNHNIYIPNSNFIRTVGDVNNDGYQDVVISTDPAAQNPSVSVLLSKGDGTYRAPITYALPAGGNPGTLALADLNGDGNLDLVTISTFYSHPSNFYLYLGNGDGTFRAPITHNVTGFFETLAAVDVNGDGKTDLLLETSSDRNTGDLDVLFSNGDGTFRAGPVTHNLLLGNLLAGDFNGDGKADIATVQSSSAGSQLAVWLGDGDGNFKMSYSDGSLENFQYVAADLNGDGISDLIATANNFCSSCTNSEEPFFTVYYGRSDGTVERAQVPTSGGCPVDMPAIADFNGDGIPDIAFGGLDCQDTTPNSVSILFGMGNGQFGSQTLIYTFTPPAVHYSDFAYPGVGLRANRDTKADLVFSQQNFALTVNRPLTSNHVITLLNTTTGSFPTCTAPNAAVGINVCSPASGSTVSSPVKFAIGASGDTPMRKVEVWADGKKQAEQFAGAFSDYSFFNNSIPLAAGSHSIVVFAAGWDNSVQSKRFTLDVGGSTCSLPTSPGVHVCSPANGATLSSPVQVTARATVTGTLASTQLWVDGVKKYSTASNSLNTSVNLAAGSHRFAVLAINTAGQKWETAVNATVK